MAKHVPMRQCSCCRKSCAKRELIRMVKTESGTLVLDERGKASGRGYYLCLNENCVDQWLQPGRLKGQLGIQMLPDDLAALKEAVLKSQRQRRMTSGDLPETFVTLENGVVVKRRGRSQ